jgi:hypothetical protein
VENFLQMYAHPVVNQLGLWFLNSLHFFDSQVPNSLPINWIVCFQLKLPNNTWELKTMLSSKRK